MLDLPSGLHDVRQRLLARPDALMLELGSGGELLVAQVRAWMSLAMLSMPLEDMSPLLPLAQLQAEMLIPLLPQSLAARQLGRDA